MSERFTYLNCPVCGATQFKLALSAKDYTVSGESFPIVECQSCTLRFTQDIPQPAEIGAYYKSDNYISHSNTGKGLINRLYHFVRKRTITRKRRLVQGTTGMGKGKILDVGSGVGSFIHEMEMSGWQTTGLEPDSDARQMALQQYKIKLREIDNLFALPANEFDAITLWHVLEHVHDLAAYVEQFKQLLKPNGRLIIAVPNYTSLDAAVYKQHWAAYDVPRHLYHFSPASMKTLVEKHGLRILQHRPLWYDSFYICLLSSKYKNGQTNWLGAGLTALRSNARALLDLRRCSSVIYIIGK